METLPPPKVEWIPIDLITVPNPRLRNQRVFREIVDNIAQIGLKRPITVTRRTTEGETRYDLVCGQGRLEAYQRLRQEEVPALVVVADAEDRMIASLVENCARRQHNAVDLLQDIGRMRREGHSAPEIARKTGLSDEYVYGIARLLEQGEQRLLRSVEAGVLPLSIALEIAEADDQDVQRALHEAYEKGLLRGRKLIAVRRLIEARKRGGKSAPARGAKSIPTRLSSNVLLRAYEQDASRKEDLIRRGNAVKDRLALITEALRRLYRDERFVRLLEDQGLSTLPENLAGRLNPQEATS